MAQPLTSGYHDPSLLADGLPHKSLLLPLPDNRVMDIEVSGMTKGYIATIIYLHGTTQEANEDIRVPMIYKIFAKFHGIRLIAPSRPGYRRSSLWTKSSCFGADAEKKKFPVSLAYLYDLVWLTVKLGIQDFGLVGHSGGAPYAIAAAGHFKSKLDSLICASDPPKFIPKVTAVGVWSGNFPRCLWHRISDCECVKGTLYDISRQIYKFAVEVSNLVYPNRQDLKSCSPEIEEIVMAKTKSPGWYAEAPTQWSTAPVEESWGFSLTEAGNFIAADGNGIRYFYGNNDPFAPALLGLQSALEIGGPFIFKTTTRSDGGFQSHGFDCPSICIVFKDMLEAMGVQTNTAAKQYGGSYRYSAELTMGVVIDNTTTTETCSPDHIKKLPQEHPKTVSVGVIRSAQRHPRRDTDDHVTARTLLDRMNIMQRFYEAGLNPAWDTRCFGTKKR